jgi:hypothetical protein
MTNSISRQELLGAGISAAAINLAVYRGVLRSAGRGVYERDSLPVEWKDIVQSGGSEYNTHIQLKRLARKLVSEARAYGINNFLDFYKKKEPTKALEDVRVIAESAGLVAMFSDVKAFRSRSIAERYPKMSIELIAEAVVVEGFYPHGVSKLSERNIRNFLAKYKDPKGLTHGNIGNANAAKIRANDDVIGWAMSLFAMGNNYPTPHVRRVLEQRCQLFAYPVPSLSWLKSFRLENEALLAEVIWDDRNPHKSRYRTYIPISKAPFAGTCWTIDGTQYNIVPHATADGQHRRLYYVCVRDEYSGDVLSAIPCYSESEEVYRLAVGLAIQTTTHLPFELRYDRFPGHNSDSWKRYEDTLLDAGVKLTITSSPFAKARHERMYATFQSVFDSLNDRSYRDSPLSTRKSARVKAELILKEEAKARKEGFNYIDAVRDLTEMIDLYRKTPLCEWSEKYRKVRHCPADLYALCTKNHVKWLKEEEIALITWERRTLQMRNGYVSFQENFVRYWYRVPPEIFYHRKPGHELTVCVNLDHSDYVYAFEGERNLFVGKFQRQQEVQAFGPDAEWDELAAAKQHKKVMKN